jgi:hypothetical protein
MDFCNTGAFGTDGAPIHHLLLDNDTEGEGEGNLRRLQGVVDRFSLEQADEVFSRAVQSWVAWSSWT